MRHVKNDSIKMGGSLKTHLPFLQVLASSSKLQTTALLKTLSKGQIKAICEVLINIRYGNIPLSDKDKKRLHRKRDFIQQLTTKTTTQTRSPGALCRAVSLCLYILNV